MNKVQRNQMQLQKHNLPSKYFDLIQIVGTQGQYQRISLIIYCITWYLTGSMLLGTPFLFYVPQYKCTGDLENFSSNQCTAYLCQLEPSKRTLYLDKSDYISSLSDQEQIDYNCESSFLYQFAKSAIYVGCLIGYVFVSPLIDNLGRKTSLVLCQILSFLGIVVVLTSSSLIQCIVGMLLAGIGLDSAIQTIFYVIAQTVDQQYRQKWSVIIQSFISIGGLGTVLYYYLLRDWRYVFIIYTITALVGAVTLILYTEQTPCFLIKKYDNQNVAKALNRIGRINFGIDNLVKIQDIEHVRHCNHHDDPNKKYVSPMALINTAPIRKITLCYCVLLSVIYFLYYGPLLMIQNFGLSVFINATVLQGSQLIAFIPMYFIIEKLPRKKTGIFFFLVIVLCSIILIILKHKICETTCVQNVLQLIVFFIFRFCTSFEFSLLLIYGYELFPAQVRGMGNGVANAFGTVLSSLTPVIVSQIEKTRFPIAILFLITAFANIVFISFLEQTKDQPLKQQIQQLLDNKELQNKEQDPKDHIELVQENHQQKQS